MIGRTVLNDAKAFLCWDALPPLFIQLVPLQKAVAYYFPPSHDSHSIVLFYDAGQCDFSESLFLLFHEVGHVQQQRILGQAFHAMLSEPGAKRQDFEREAWQCGRMALQTFIEKHALDEALLLAFDAYAERSVASYAELENRPVDIRRSIP